MNRVHQFQFSRSAEETFVQYDINLQQRILSKLSYYEKSKNPLSFAKRLTGIENTFRFRVGDYRILVRPQDNGTLVILLIIKIGHRREVYE